jgi:hypothetical protein
MRADDTACLHGQASQVHLAVTFRDACGAESFAAVPLDDLLSAGGSSCALPGDLLKAAADPPRPAARHRPCPDRRTLTLRDRPAVQ